MVDLYSLKIATEKVEQIQDTLNALDEATALISAFTQTEENQQLLSALLDNIDDVKQIVNSVDLMETTTEDINKGTYLGNRKTDIDISLNKTGIAQTITSDEAMAIWLDTTNTVYYNKATVKFVDGAEIVVDFVNDDNQVINVSTHGAIVDQLLANVAFTTKMANTRLTEEVGGKTGTIIQITDTIGNSSNIERIRLHAVAGSFVNAEPIYFWAQTTSALQTLANRVNDIINLGNDIDKIITLSSRIDEVMELQNALNQMMAIHADLTELMAVHANLPEILQADENAAIATQKAQEVTDIRNEIHAITAEATTGAAGGQAAAIYNPVTGKFTFVIPQGLKGDKGEAFQVNAVGLIANRGIYDAQTMGFSFLAIDEASIYFKLSDTSGDWSLGAPFGKGEKGDTGEDGKGIVGIQKTATVANVDTYTITFTDGSTYSYDVTNTNVDDTVIALDSTWSSSKIDSEITTRADSALLDKTTPTPIINIAGSFNERTTVQGTITVDTDSIVQSFTATVGTVSGLSKLNSITWEFSFIHDITDDNDDTVTFSCYATKAGELRSDEATATSTVVYVPIIADETLQVVDFSNDFDVNEGWAV